MRPASSPERAPGTAFQRCLRRPGPRREPVLKGSSRSSSTGMTRVKLTTSKSFEFNRGLHWGRTQSGLLGFWSGWRREGGSTDVGSAVIQVLARRGPDLAVPPKVIPLGAPASASGRGVPRRERSLPNDRRGALAAATSPPNRLLSGDERITQGSGHHHGTRRATANAWPMRNTWRSCAVGSMGGTHGAWCI